MTIGDTFGPGGRRPQLRGVAGWLLFLCISLMVFLPIRVAFFLLVILTTPGSLDRLSLVVLVPIVALPLVGIVGGILLYREQILGLRLVQVFLGLQVLFGVVALIGGAGASALLFMAPSIAWLVYLFMSERVRNTYSRDKSDSTADVFR